MLLIAPNTITLTRPNGLQGDADDSTPAPTSVIAGWRVAITSPSGSDVVVGGQQETIDSLLLAPTTPVIQRTDLVTDDDSNEAYSVVWVRRRRGLGLDHQVAGLRAVAGGAG